MQTCWPGVVVSQFATRAPTSPRFRAPSALRFRNGHFIGRTSQALVLRAVLAMHTA